MNKYDKYKQTESQVFPRIIIAIVLIVVGVGSPLYILWERNVLPDQLGTVPTYQPALLEETPQPLFRPFAVTSSSVQRIENETSRPLWRHLVDCQAAMSNLCELSRYEFAKSGFWQRKCASTTPTTVVDTDSSSSILVHRRRLRSLIEGNPASSPLTGYATPSVAIKGMVKSEQVGCDGTTNYQKSIELIVSKWKHQNNKETPLGFTMTDSKYMDLVEDQYWVAMNIVKLDSFFVAAYDFESVAHTCGLGIDVVVPTNEDTRISVDSTLRARTVISKFKVAESLALMGVTFLFWEMDVFIFKYPEPILASLSDTNVDIIVSAHQYSPLEPNIGVFGARGSPKTVLVFQNTMSWTEQDTKLHDQRAFCLVTRLCRNKNFKQSPINVPLPEDMQLSVKLTNSHDVAASVTPRAVAGETMALHVLSTTPLQSSVAKSYIAREGRGHPASDRWLHTGGDDVECGTRLIAVEGTVSLSRGQGYHCVDCMRWTMSWLIALALSSNRTLVLPPIMFDFDFQFAAIYIELASISQLVPWRETNFLSDPRFQKRLSKCRKPSSPNSDADYDSPYPFNSLERISLGQGKDGRFDITRRRSLDGVDCSVFSCVKKDFEAIFMDTIAASEAEIVFIDPSALWQQRSPVLQKEGLVTDVYRSLKFCIKGMENGASKGTMPDTKIGNLCLKGEQRGGEFQRIL